MCDLIAASRGPVDIANVIILAVALVMLARAVYLLALGWGNTETTRYVWGLSFKALGWIAIAVVLNITLVTICS